MFEWLVRVNCGWKRFGCVCRLLLCAADGLPRPSSGLFAPGALFPRWDSLTAVGVFVIAGWRRVYEMGVAAAAAAKTEDCRCLFHSLAFRRGRGGQRAAVVVASS